MAIERAGNPSTWMRRSLTSSCSGLTLSSGGRRLEQDVARLFGGADDGVTRDVGGAAGDGAGVHGSDVGVAGDHVDIVGGQAQGFRRDLREHRQGPLTGFHGTGEQRRRTVRIDLHRCRTGVGGHREADGIPHAGHAASALLHACHSFQRKRSAAWVSDSFSATLCRLWPVGLREFSEKPFRNRISRGSIPRASAMSSICDS